MIKGGGRDLTEEHQVYDDELCQRQWRLVGVIRAQLTHVAAAYTTSLSTNESDNEWKFGTGEGECSGYIKVETQTRNFSKKISFLRTSGGFLSESLMSPFTLILKIH